MCETYTNKIANSTVEVSFNVHSNAHFKFSCLKCLEFIHWLILHWLWIHQGSGGTKQALYRVDEQIIGFSGPCYSLSAHVVLENVDKGGVKLTARIVVMSESLIPFSHFQLLTPLSTQQVETPRGLKHRGRAMVLTHLEDERGKVQRISK